MKKIQYLEIVKAAFLLAWKNKFLWIFGFMILLGSFSVFINYDSKQTNGQFANFISEYSFLSLLISIVFLLLLLGLILIKIIGNAAIIKATSNIVVYKQCSVSSIISETKRFTGKLFFLEIIIALGLGIIGAILLVPIVYLLSLNNLVFASLSFTLAFFIILPLIILAYYLRRYSYVYIILGEFHIKTAMEAAYSLLENNFKESLLMGLISLLLNILLVAIILSVFVAIGILSTPFVLVSYFIFSKIGAIIIAGLFGFLVIVVAIVLASAFQVFSQAAWVMFFKEISLEKESKKKEEESVKVEANATPEAI